MHIDVFSVHKLDLTGVELSSELPGLAAVWQANQSIVHIQQAVFGLQRMQCLPWVGSEAVDTLTFITDSIDSKTMKRCNKIEFIHSATQSLHH